MHKVDTRWLRFQITTGLLAQEYFVHRVLMCRGILISESRFRFYLKDRFTYSSFLKRNMLRKPFHIACESTYLIVNL